MARRFVAERWSNCADCEDLIEPGDEAGVVDEVTGAVCTQCFEYWTEVEFWESFEKAQGEFE